MEPLARVDHDFQLPWVLDASNSIHADFFTGQKKIVTTSRGKVGRKRSVLGIVVYVHAPRTSYHLPSDGDLGKFLLPLILGLRKTHLRCGIILSDRRLLQRYLLPDSIAFSLGML